MIPYSSDSRRLSLLCLQARHQGAYGLNRVEIVGYDLDGGYLDVECIFELGHEGDHRQRIDAARIDEVDARLMIHARVDVFENVDNLIFQSPFSFSSCSVDLSCGPFDELNEAVSSRCRAMRIFPETSRTTTDGRSRLKNSARPSVAQ